MKPRFWILWAALIGGLTALPVAGIFYVGNQSAGLPFIPFDWFDWTARVLPGGLVTFGIDTIVAFVRMLELGPTDTTAKLVEQVMAILQFCALGSLLAVIFSVIHFRRPDRLMTVGLLLAAVVWVVTLLIQGALNYSPTERINSAFWTAAVFILWVWILAATISLVLFQRQLPAQVETSRRQFLRWAGLGMAALLGVVLTVGTVRRRARPVPVTSGGEAVPTPDVLQGLEQTSGQAVSPPIQELEARIDPVPGTRPEITPIDEFYRIDINTRAPVIDGETWRLQVNGLVDNPLSLSLPDIRSRPSVSQAATLSCISNPLAGDLISTAIWTGVRVKDILEEAVLQPGVRELFITAEDGFYESVPIEEAMDDRTLLVYAMNLESLTPEHGFPLRIFIPDHFGMKQPKWISTIEAVDDLRRGYWVERGWSEKAIVQTTSVIDTIAIEAVDPEIKSLPIGGIAYAGARGISRVEVQVDDGAWLEAQLRTPALGPLTWVHWRYDWPSEPGRHTVSVRAFDGTGQLQEVEFRDVRPDGATGIHRQIVDVPSIN